MRAASGWRSVSQRHDDMQLHVGDDAVVQFKMRRGSCPAVGSFRVLRGEVKFPVLMVHWFRVVRHKRRPGQSRQGTGQQYSGLEYGGHFHVVKITNRGRFANDARYKLVKWT